MRQQQARTLRRRIAHDVVDVARCARASALARSTSVPRSPDRVADDESLICLKWSTSTISTAKGFTVAPAADITCAAQHAASSARRFSRPVSAVAQAATGAGDPTPCANDHQQREHHGVKGNREPPIMKAIDDGGVESAVRLVHFGRHREFGHDQADAQARARRRSAPSRPSGRATEQRRTSQRVIGGKAAGGSRPRRSSSGPR